MVTRNIGGTVVASVVRSSDAEEDKRDFLSIPYERTCACADNHVSCISAKGWIKAQLGVWQFDYEKRDIRDKIGLVCPNCTDGCLAEQYCYGCDLLVCIACYQEHNEARPCHVLEADLS